MNDNFKSDYYRMTGNKWNSINGMIQMLLRYDLRYLHLIRRKKSKIRNKKSEYPEGYSDGPSGGI